MFRADRVGRRRPHWRLFTLALIFVSSAVEAQIEVQEGGDPLFPALTTLRVAVEEANAVPGESTIGFAAPLQAATIGLTSPLDTIVEDLTIDGRGGDDVVTIDGSNAGTESILELGSGITTELLDINLVDGDVTVPADSTLIFELDSPRVITSDAGYKGGGALTKRGDGTLTLSSGDNEAFGSIAVEGGRLALDISDSVGSDPSVSTGSVLELRVESAVDDYASVISGAGAFDKSGNGRLEFTNPQTYTGGTTVSGGVLSSQNLPLDRALAISAGATLEFDVPMGAMTPVSGAITGAGSIDKSGSGVLVFSGSNGFTGDTTLRSGEIQGPGTSIPGNVQMSGGTEIEFTDTGTSTYSGSGMLSLTGDNSGFVGTLDIQSGTVSGNVASLPDRITNAAALIFNQGSNASYAGVISGEGGVTKSGSGTLTITNDQSYTGATMISAGRLNTNATLAGAVNVGSGATLGGTGVVAGPITVSGTIAPGVENSPEPTLDTILTAQASVSFEANSTFRPILFENRVANQLRALGEVTIDPSATLDPSFANITAGSEFTVLRASAFTVLDPDEPFQVPEFAFVSITQMIEDVGGESMLNLIIESGGPALPLADTANQFQVARALDTTDANSTLADAISSLKGSSLTPDQARAVFDDISPEVVGGFASTRLSVARRVNDQIQAIKSPLGLGWKNVVWQKVTLFDALIKLLGWTVTALAISLGAPFWFDLLRKLVNIRSSGNKPE